MTLLKGRIEACRKFAENRREARIFVHAKRGHIKRNFQDIPTASQDYFEVQCTRLASAGGANMSLQTGADASFRGDTGIFVPGASKVSLF